MCADVITTNLTRQPTRRKACPRPARTQTTRPPYHPTIKTFNKKMPRLVTPFSNPHVHGSHALTPYSRRERSPASPALSSSDKENAANSPPQTQHAPSNSQAAYRKHMAERSNTQYYDPNQAREKTRAMSKRYRELQQDVNGFVARDSANGRKPSRISETWE
jgi:hypothetical protein